MRPVQAFIDGRWAAGASAHFIETDNPSTGEPHSPWAQIDPSQLEEAVAAARRSGRAWARASLAARKSVLQRFAEAARVRAEDLAEVIVDEVGKPRWEARGEAAAVVGKVALAIRAYGQRCREFGEGTAITRFKPHGVLGVLGPFNFPAHLPNGHIVPALLAGNSVVFKPSERTPSAAIILSECWEAAGLPPGVFNLVPGGADVGVALSNHDGIDGLLFTGGVRVGAGLRQIFAEQPGKILALELGGNNPLVVWETAAIEAAALTIVQSAFITAGQRCTCARRLIIPQGQAGDCILEALLDRIERIRVGRANDEPSPFMGPVIKASSAEMVIAAQDNLAATGAVILREAKHVAKNTGLVTPGVVDATAVSELPDEEVFGPLLVVRRVSNFEAAIEEANNTRYGLAAGLLSDRRELYEAFYTGIRAGIVNWNTPLTGASGAAPFGGIGWSGNHRPSGFFAADYCAYPVGSLERDILTVPETLPPGLAL